MLHHAKLICSSDSLFFRKVDIFKLLCLASNYPLHFFDKILGKFLIFLSPHTKGNENSHACESCFFKVLYIGPPFKQFTKGLSALVCHQFSFEVKVVAICSRSIATFTLKQKNHMLSASTSCSHSMFVCCEPCLRSGVVIKRHYFLKVIILLGAFTY